jgi:hypothetical protein
MTQATGGPELPTHSAGWSWRAPSHGEHFRCCGYCGCIHPEDLAAEPDWRAEWADRKYGWPHKFYVDVPNRDPSALFVVSAASGEDHGTALLQWVRATDLTDEQQAIIKRDGWRGGDFAWFGFGTRPNHHAKFYTEHLADPQLPAEVKAAIERRCGLRFTFPNGGISWQPA